MAAKRNASRKTNSARSRKNIIYVVGYGRLPEGVPAKHVYGILSLGVELERESGKMLEVSCTAVPSHGGEIIRRILRGKSLEKDFASISEEIRWRFIDRTRGALLAALEDALRRFCEAKRYSSA